MSERCSSTDAYNAPQMTRQLWCDTMADSRFLGAYVRRVIDDELDELFPQLPAIVLDGPKGVGKTVTAEQRCTTPGGWTMRGRAKRCEPTRPSWRTRPSQS